MKLLNIACSSEDCAGIIQLIKSCAKKKDILNIRRICTDKSWITQDVCIASSLIRSYAKCGALKEAREIFSQLTLRNVVSWTALIAGYADQGFGKEALTCFREMTSYGFTPNSVTYVCALKACAIVGAPDTLQEIHTQLKEQGLLKNDIILGTALLNAYTKCGALVKARGVFDQLAERNVVSWSSLIAGYADQGYGEEALKCFREMESHNVAPNSATYICTLKACGIVRDTNIVKEIHSQVREEGLLKSDVALGTALITAYFRCGLVEQAQEVFDQLVVPDVVSWSALVAGYADQGFGERAVKCFRQMKNNAVAPNSVTYICTLKACTIMQAIGIVKEINAQLRKQRVLEKDVELGTALVNAYMKCGDLNKAQKVFNLLVRRDVVSWSALIAGYTEQGFGEEALKCFEEMESHGEIPNSVTYLSCLKACAIAGALDIVVRIHSLVTKQGLLKKDIDLGTTLINAYTKCGALKEAREVLNECIEQKVESWSSIIGGYVDEGLVEEALTCFRHMEKHLITPDSVTYTCILKACAIIGALGIVEQIHMEAREQLESKDIVLGTTLVNAYAKCGAVKEARKVFEQLEELNIESWSALLAGYAQLGWIEEMLELFNKMMEKGSSPDEVTFLILLNGCSHGAFLEEGQRLFSMIGKYGLSPTPEHYACMVDLFGRAGQLDTAKCFVVDSTPTLLAMLGACQKWINVDLGRWAFKKLLKLDQNCADAYISMANIYASQGMIKEADELSLCN